MRGLENDVSGFEGFDLLLLRGERCRRGARACCACGRHYGHCQVQVPTAGFHLSNDTKSIRTLMLAKHLDLIVKAQSL